MTETGCAPVGDERSMVFASSSKPRTTPPARAPAPATVIQSEACALRQLVTTATMIRPEVMASSGRRGVASSVGRHDSTATSVRIMRASDGDTASWATTATAATAPPAATRRRRRLVRSDRPTNSVASPNR